MATTVNYWRLVADLHDMLCLINREYEVLRSATFTDKKEPYPLQAELRDSIGRALDAAKECAVKCHEL